MLFTTNMNNVGGKAAKFKLEFVQSCFHQRCKELMSFFIPCALEACVCFSYLKSNLFLFTIYAFSLCISNSAHSLIIVVF